jgi:cytochrome c oxidase cbb3-type subunit I/II
MLDPQSMSPGSIMPAYPWLFENKIEKRTTVAKIKGMQMLGVPYEEGYADVANDDLEKQANTITENLKKNKVDVLADREIIAMIAYLQRLGTDIKGNTKPLTLNQ